MIRKSTQYRERQIIQHLEANPGQNYTDIAKAVGLSEGRIKVLLLGMIHARRVGKIRGLNRFQYYSIQNCGNGCLCDYCRRKIS